MNKYIFVIICFVGLIISCNSKSEKYDVDSITNSEAETNLDSVNANSSGEKSSEVYISSDEQYQFSIISKQKKGEEEKILLQNDVSGRIYDMKKVNSYTGDRYLDDENYYFWINGSTFSFGKGDDVIVEGKIVNLSKISE